ncbi:putative metal-dependent phosphohydrolase protein [Rhizobium phage RHph_X2_25]|nr:putative metal-dependent phosphohydrolase protein [Rhizobium phage RHph_X2_25]
MVITFPQKQYNEATTTFGPLEKYVPANDNVPPKWSGGCHHCDGGRKSCVCPGPSVPVASQPAPERRGPFIQVWPNRKFYPFDPHPCDVYIESIAHGLSNICRYSGAVIEGFSVAEHSTLIARYLAARYAPEVALCGLLHDAPEALSGFGDVGRPVKDKAPIIKQTEDNIWRLAVSTRFQLPKELPTEVHEADTRILADEKILLHPMAWQDRYNEPLGVLIRCWTPAKAKQEFLATFETLMNARAA